MSVGLYDFDFFKHHQVMFNLEIMKMATYFKSKKEITMLSPTYSPDRYTTFYLRKDFYDGDFPVGLNRHKNLIYGGLAFTNNEYIALEEDIERCKPDVFIYERYKGLFVDGLESNRSAYTSLVNNSHLRLSLDGETVWPQLEKQISKDKNRILFIHDPDIAKIKDSPEVVKYLLNKYNYFSNQPARLGLKFPIQVQGAADLSPWVNIPYSDVFSSVKIKNILDDEEFIETINLAEAKVAKKIIYNLADVSSSKNDFLIKALPKIFKQVIFCCRQKKKILLEIDDNFLVSQEWRDVITLLNSYLSAAQNYREAMPALYLFCKNMREEERKLKSYLLSKEDARRIFMFVAENQPELFKLFYECNQVKLINGGLEDVSLR